MSTSTIIIRPVEHAIERPAGIHAAVLRLESTANGSGLRIILDGRALGVLPASFQDGVAGVSEGEYALSDGWTARIEADYEDDSLRSVMLEAGEPVDDIEFGYRTGGILRLMAPLSPMEQQAADVAVARGYNPLVVGRLGVSLDFRPDGSVCGAGSCSTVVEGAIAADA